MSRAPLAFVVQRYGAEATGGSEALCRALAERLAAERPVTVFTTCARDYLTWRNEYPAGRTPLAGVELRRFPVAEERDLAAFNAYSDALFARLDGRAPGGPPSDEEERTWLRRQGPYAPALIDELQRAAPDFELVVFFTYLYHPTVAGLEALSTRTLLVPTAHDEPPLRLRLYRRTFGRPRALAFLTPPEARLVRERFPEAAAGTLCGTGIDLPGETAVEEFEIRHGVRPPYLVYAGRIEAGKGCAELLDFYGRYRSSRRGAAQLLLAGRLAMPEPRGPGVRYLGFLDEPHKAAALAGACAVVCPSPYESLSIVLLEALGLGTPVIANARSPVLVDHCRRSQAGLFYAGADEFAECADLLVRVPALRAVLGSRGREYVAREWRWEVVLERWRALLDEVARG